MVKIINFLTLIFLGSVVGIWDYVIYKILLFNCHGENYTLAEIFCIPEVWWGGGMYSWTQTLNNPSGSCPRQICPVKF